jgi:deoxycytidine triphosphate deaminase
MTNNLASRQGEYTPENLARRLESMTKKFEEIVPAAGFLVDVQIRAALIGGYLIEKGTWEESQIRHASYQLRLGDRVEISRASQAGTQNTKELSIVRLSKANDTLEIRPGDTALLYSLENIRLPDSVLGFTVARGLLFVESLVPENTYIDPGFSGTLYTTVTNVSNRVVHLKYQTAIARMFLFRLPCSVENTYNTGAAIGISQQLESVPASAIPSIDDARGAKNRILLDEIRRVPMGGVHIAEALSRGKSREERIAIFSAIWPIIFFAFNTSVTIRDAIHSALLINVLGGLVTAALVYLGSIGLKKLREE